MRLTYILFLIFVSIPPVSAEIVRSSGQWTVKPNFEKSSKARESISGAACVPGTNHCLAANDEKNYAQFFEIEDGNLVPTRLIRLLPKKIDGEKMDEIDAEGVVFVPAQDTGGKAYFYVTGSHGLSRSGDYQPSRYMLLRFPVDPRTGNPTFNFDGNRATPDVERTTLLRETIKTNADLSPYADKTLDRNGVTIEGIATIGTDMLFGLRSPCLAKSAVIVRVPMGDLFKNTVPHATTSLVKMGDNVGVRDLANVQDGILILAGRSDDRRGSENFTCGEKRAPPSPLPSVWFWSGRDGDAARPLGDLPGVKASASAETLLVLEETANAYRVLILFDGKKNGKPVEFTIEK
ncbi:hypothetical protein LP7551_03053 [Roseibium album]|nr:hypothetical protein LP7551_03053 [Roseibium album]